MPLQVDYRPQTFDEMLGNLATIESLKSIYFSRESDFPHAVLLQGPKGSGKTTTARIIAGLLKCCGSDLVQIDGGDVKAETVRQIKEQCRYKPIMGKSRVWILEEAHMCGQGGGTEKNIPQNNLLTLIEEPPKHAYFILCTTDPQRLVGTLRDRCHTFEFKYLSMSETVQLLDRTLKQENISDIPANIIRKIAETSEGCPREALRILDQIIDMPVDRMERAISSFNYDEQQVSDLCQALLNRQGWNRIRLIVKKMDLSNPENSRRGVVGYMAKVVMGGDNPTAALIYEAFREPLFNTGKPGFEFACYQAASDVSG